jgi:hypothetical protein
MGAGRLMSIPRGVRPSDYLIERFENFLRNDFAHLERKVAEIDGRLQILMWVAGITHSVLIGLMVWAVVNG